MLADSSTNPTSESVEAFVTEIARQRETLAPSRSFREIREAAHHLGLNRIAPKQVVVGGTNGKGSTVCYLRQILSHQGLRVGTTTSPHLHSYLERIMLDGEHVTASECFDALETIANDTHEQRLSYFDLTTLAALYLFKQWDVDVAIIEVGLGGRFDCANVVDGDVAVITNIDIDHSAILGNTIASISREKVPIVRPNKPLVFSDPRENSVIRQYALKHHSPLYQSGRQFGLTDPNSVFVSTSVGRRTFSVPPTINFAVESFGAAMQVAALIDCVPIEEDLGSIRFATPEGRLERAYTRDREWILDVAHNPSAIRFLRQELARQNIDHCVVVFACLDDKDMSGMLEALLASLDCSAVEVAMAVITDSHGTRGLSANSIAEKIERLDHRFQVESNLNDALMIAAKMSTQDTPIVVLGSFDVVSRARSVLNSCITENSID